MLMTERDILMKAIETMQFVIKWAIERGYSEVASANTISVLKYSALRDRLDEQDIGNDILPSAFTTW